MTETSDQENVQCELPFDDTELPNTQSIVPELVVEEERSPPSSVRARSPRRVRRRLVYVGPSPRKQNLAPITLGSKVASRGSRANRSTPVPSPKRSETPVHMQDPKNEIIAGLLFMRAYAIDVVSRAFRLLRRPLSFLLFLWIFALIFTPIMSKLRMAFAPLCYIPGISFLRVCHHDTPSGNGAQPPQWADYPRLVDIQSTTFEQLMNELVGGSALSLEVKKAEMATTDLVTLVRVSELKSREMIANTLVDFVNEAKKTGRGLQKLSSKVNGAVDGIMAVNDFALRSIEAAEYKSSLAYSLNNLLPWHAPVPTNEIVLQTFTDAMNSLSSSMERLILEAEVSLLNLDQLEERLSTLHELLLREDSSIAFAKNELLSQLWTRLGGNKGELRQFDKNLFLLKNLGEYRKQALIHVVAALQMLQAMGADMEDMRERVAAPELTTGKIPIEVHLKSIRNGLERLREGRINAKEREDEAVRRVLDPLL